MAETGMNTGTDRIFVFQGGGALGAYQAGAYEALHENEVEPDWLAGISIGAINAAIIAGSPTSDGSPTCATSGRSCHPVSTSAGRPETTG